MGQTQGMAGRRHPLRKDRPILHGRPRPRRHGLAQTLTEPNHDVDWTTESFRQNY